MSKVSEISAEVKGMSGVRETILRDGWVQDN